MIADELRTIVAGGREAFMTESDPGAQRAVEIVRGLLETLIGVPDGRDSHRTDFSVVWDRIVDLTASGEATQ